MIRYIFQAVKVTDPSCKSERAHNEIPSRTGGELAALLVAHEKSHRLRLP